MTLRYPHLCFNIGGFLFAAFAVGCGGTTYDYAGHSIYEYFPLDGERTWTYVPEDSDDEGETVWQLEVEKVFPTETQGNTEIITLEYSKEGDALLFSVQWSSDSVDGVLIHGYTDEETGAAVTYDPPVVFGDYQMTKGESVTSQGDGVTFTSTFQGVESCQNYWTTDEWECLHFVLDDGDSDDEAGLPFAGEWWIANTWGTSWFMPTGYTVPWVLTSASWAPEEER